MSAEPQAAEEPRTPAGHVNSASRLGDWPAGFALLERLRTSPWI